MSSTLDTVVSEDWQLSIQEPDALVQAGADISQCIDLILRTTPGTDPLRPEFGTRYLDHIDKPTPIAAPRIVTEIFTAIQRWEKRVTVERVTYRIEGERILYQVNWTSKYGQGINILPL
jgi:phage baseplate assembly protein W